jgi:transposase InsO family protein
MRNRLRYDTSLVCLYAIGREALIPQHLRARVPHSTASTWRTLDTALLVGHELRAFQGEAIDHYALLSKYRALKRMVCTLVRVWDRLAGIVLPALQRNKEHDELLIDSVQQLLAIMPKERALHLARISSTVFHNRLARIKERCGLSAVGRCFKRHPQQLSMSETNKLKALFNRPAYAHWPAASLFHQGWRSHGLHMARSTFYKYVRALGLQRPRPKAMHKREGLKATEPNQYLHLDTTHVRVDPDNRLSVAIVSDNFSKAVLGISIALNKGAANTAAALKEAIATIQKHHPQHKSANLVCDGGGENRASVVTELILGTDQPEITRIIAQQDIIFSNSPVEAINKILKNYLRRMKPQGVAATIAAIRWALNDYTYVRPHGSIDGLIPWERYLEPERKPDNSTQRRMAQALRIAANRVGGCGTCA